MFILLDNNVKIVFFLAMINHKTDDFVAAFKVAIIKPVL